MIRGTIERVTDRRELVALIVQRLQKSQSRSPSDCHDSHGLYVVVDDLLPEILAESISDAFPASSSMTLRSSIRERKFVTAQLDQCHPLIEQIVYAFQDRRIVDTVQQIMDVPLLEPDERLYAGGISVMTKGHYLNPHLDNSHDMLRQRYRVLNLLYYATPGWREEYGGNLELWPGGVEQLPVVIPSLFNRLVIMMTNRTSWHSVSKIVGPLDRKCVSNYFFSQVSPEGEDYFHPTSFRGRPEEPVRDLVLRGDAMLRAGVRKIAKKGILPNWHFYRKD